jgi:hypothetical protein
MEGGGLMARKSITELEAELPIFFPDNTSGEITPQDVRSFFSDFLGAVRPAYGYITKALGSAQTVGTVPSNMLWTGQYDSSANETVSNFSSGTVTRTERGNSVITFTTDFEAPNGRFVTFTLFKDGAATTWRVTGNGGGNGNPVGISLSAVDYCDPAAVFSIAVSAEVDGTSVNISNAALIVSVQPVNSYA